MQDRLAPGCVRRGARCARKSLRVRQQQPYKYVDPDGRSTIAVGIVGGATILAVGAWKYATDPKARAVINRAIEIWRSGSEPKKSDSADAAKSDGKNGTNTAPPVPEDYVGVQGEKPAPA